MIMETAKNAGVKTSEFALLTVYGVLGILLNIGWITASQATQANLAAPSIIADVGTALGVVTYILSRSGLKWKWFNNLASGQQSTAPAPTFAPLVDSPPAPSYSSPASQPQNGVVTGGLSAVQQPQAQIRSV